MPKEEGDVVRAYKAKHEENVLSSWLREDGEDKEEKHGGGQKGEEEEEENESVIVKRRCVNLVSAEAFVIFFVRRRFRRVVEILGVIFGMNLVARLTVTWTVCLWFLCLCPPLPRWL